jgi:hypothetical protein
MAMHLPGRSVAAAISVGLIGRGVRREDRLRLAQPVETFEEFELQIHLLKDRLYDEFRSGDRLLQIVGGRDAS